MKNIFRFWCCVICLSIYAGPIMSASWLPTQAQTDLLGVVQESLLDRQQTWTLQKNDLMNERLDYIYEKHEGSDIVTWFVSEVRKTLDQLSNPTPTGEGTIAEIPVLITVQELLVTDNELGFLRVRELPTTLSPELGQLNIGERRQFWDERDGWYQIEYNNKIGRVAGRYVDVQEKKTEILLKGGQETIVENTDGQVVFTDEDEKNDSLVIMDTEVESDDDIYTSYTISQFVDRRYPEVHEWSKEELSDVNTCLVHYDAVDAVAREMDFPTSLIIATWYREYNCRMENPANTRGPFQVTSSYKEPGPITVDQLLVEVREFIEFSRGKYEYYTKLWKFDEIPVKLSHEVVDLVSLQKHSILYNGMYTGVTPANSSYANQNFWTGDTNRRDGIVAMFLKIEQARR